MQQSNHLIHFYVFGRVQGVGYRAWTVRTAKQFNLSGWVRNRRNGCVEIYAQGDLKNIELFRQSCLKGPLWSRVDNLMPVSTPDAPLFPIEDGIFKQIGTV